MRLKRFRAWDKTNKEYYMEGMPFDLDFSGSYGNFFFDNDHPHNMRNVKLVWEQFTGWQDKIGASIYEGDKLSYQNLVWECVFDNGCFIARTVNSSQWRYLYEIVIHVEVIGNIHDSTKEE